MYLFPRRLAATLPACALGALGLSSTSTRRTVQAAAGESPERLLLRVAVIQMKSGADKAKNLERCRELLGRAAGTGADMVVLPEVWNSPYAVGAFREHAEPIGLHGEPTGPSTRLLQDFAKANGVFVVGGSIPEISSDGACVYNTSPVVDPSGTVVAKHRKVHLFDIDVPGKIRFMESETLAPGNSRTVVPLPDSLGGGALGVAICYDMRFAELAVSMRKHGATVLIYPGAFNTVTGPPHYHLLARARALDSQAFVIAASPARNPEAAYQAFGHSIIVDPWGAPLAQAQGHDEEIIVAQLDLGRVAEVRASMRLLDQRRPDVY